ncbi:hypothetical protein NLJ89_g5143 [Agrocybe chaxingu]|uniref:Cytochrome P450 n=1 Tax=Agrocybe chaxingu TaxID=84603 RepID=A0A9W8MVA2_9AGAR|nr:hypothetical protein NLJ89_g5143 [Agrocybe chaxingu]
MPPLLALLDAALLALGFVLLHKMSNKRTAPLPPGPRKLPLFGNLLDMPREREWLTFAEWGSKWGDMVSVSVLGRQIIVLNSAKTAVEMLDRKSANYSERPVLELMGEIVGWKHMLVLLPSGEHFRAQRKLFRQALGSTSSVAQFYPLLERETHKFLKCVRAQSHLLESLIHKTAGAIVLRITYGYEIQEDQDPFLALAHETTEDFSIGSSPGGFLVNILPVLRYIPKWLPGGGYKKTGAIWANTMNEMVNRPYEWVKEQLMLGTAELSVVSRILDSEPNPTPTREHDIKWLSSSMYAGGADTTVSSIRAFFLAMVLYPDAMRKAQEEMDAVIGPERLPKYSDRDNLPYTNALIMEVMRWHAVAPLGAPHCVKEDDVHNGYFIPKGAMVMANVWNMLHDPKVYPVPFNFKPERFLGPHPEPDPYDVCFGFGRRPLVEHGKTIMPEHEQLAGTVSHPKSFKCSIEPRSLRAESLINSDL